MHDDLHAATQLARRMVTSFGMSEALGPVTIGEREGEVFLGASLQDLGSVGPSTLELIDREVERLVGEALEKATVVLERNWGAVEETAQRAARARDAVGRRARRGAVDRAADAARARSNGRRAATAAPDAPKV